MRRLFTTIACAAILAVPAWAQSDVTQAQINELTETNKAILKELQEIRKLLQQAQARSAAPPADALPIVPVNVAGEPFKGARNAKVAIVVFSDFQCSFCARYERDTYPQLIKDYVDTGMVKYVWRDLPLERMHPNAFKAAEAAHCAGEQARFWEMHDVLFGNSRNLSAEELPKYGEAAKLDPALFQQCLASGRHAAAIRKDMEDAEKLGITGTPSFLIGFVQPNGSVKVSKKLVGAKPFAEFKSALDTILAPPSGGTP
jgi:protein-disulfide isomerase